VRRGIPSHTTEGVEESIWVKWFIVFAIFMSLPRPRRCDPHNFRM
jgi:hypothetical protein